MSRYVKREVIEEGQTSFGIFDSHTSSLVADSKFRNAADRDAELARMNSIWTNTGVEPDDYDANERA